MTWASTEATIQNLEIAGPSAALGGGLCGELGYGVFVAGGAELTSQHNCVMAIRERSPVGCQQGRAIGHGRVQTAHGVVDDNVNDDCQKTGIVVSNAGTTVTVNTTTITGRS